MQFVKLTSAVSNATLHINAAYIVGFYYDATTEQTVVTVRGEKDEVQVKESPEAILSVVEGSGGFVWPPVAVGSDPASAPS